MKMLDASEVKATINGMEHLLNEGMANCANDLADIRQNLAAAREGRDSKLANIAKRQSALDTERQAAHDEYRKAETDAMTQLVTLEQAMRPADRMSKEQLLAGLEGKQEGDGGTVLSGSKPDESALLMNQSEPANVTSLTGKKKASH